MSELIERIYKDDKDYNETDDRANAGGNERTGVNLPREDYEEPVCLLDMDRSEERPLVSVPIGRVIEKLDELFFMNDFDAAERHLKYWLSEAQQGRDRRAELTLRNEMMGFYRQRGRRSEAYEAVSEGLRLLSLLEFEGSLSAAATYLNCATVYKVFEEPEKAVEYYERARALYEKYLPAGDTRLGGLYNNLALALVDLGRLDEADGYYLKAIDIMEASPGGAPEAAISYLNLADEVVLRLGALESEPLVCDCLDRAAALLDSEKDRADGYYAYVCEKCAAVYSYYGYFLYEKELKERARLIHERAGDQ